MEAVVSRIAVVIEYAAFDLKRTPHALPQVRMTFHPTGTVRKRKVEWPLWTFELPLAQCVDYKRR